MVDPRKAKTLDEAALNPDGKTYNGAKALAWLSEALTPGKGLSEQEVAEMWRRAKGRKNVISSDTDEARVAVAKTLLDRIG